MNKIFESESRIKSILDAIDNKTHQKHLNLSYAFQSLYDGYMKPVNKTIEFSTSTHSLIPLESSARIRKFIEATNTITGENNITLTEAAQKLCDGYTDAAPLYSFGVLSDLHIQYETGLEDFQRALTYLKDIVPFTCICGDLVSYASADYMAEYKECVDIYSDGMPLYECAGNHETYPGLGVSGELDIDLWETATGKKPYYTFEYENDVFIFLSLKSEDANDLFIDGSLEWLDTILEINNDKRCFVFQHVHDPANTAADPSHAYSNILEGISGNAFLTIIKKHPNVVWFHGHTHLTLNTKQYPINESLGYKSIHIPSLSAVRFYNELTNSIENSYLDENGNTIWGAISSEGYVIDVFVNKIVVRGINFAQGTNKNEVKPFEEEVYVLYTKY